MNRQNDFRQQPTVGGSSLVVMFAVLCLTVFALLGLSTVRADQHLSDATAASVETYYKAELQAETVLAELRAGTLPDGVTQDGDIYTYTCPISDALHLQVSVHITDSHWEILSWRTETAIEWNEDDSLSVWNGK